MVAESCVVNRKMEMLMVSSSDEGVNMVLISVQLDSRWPPAKLSRYEYLS